MDTSNWRPNQGGSGGGDSSMESVDWRTQLPSDFRQKLVNKTFDILKKHFQLCGPEKTSELKNTAVMFEEKIYTAATSNSDYMRKISVKLMNLEQKIANTLQSNSGGSSVNPSDPGSQGMQQVNNQGQQRPIPIPSNHPQPGQQILSQNIHNNIPSTGLQVSAGVSSALPPGSSLSQSTMSNIPGQNPSLQNIQNMSGVQQNSVGNSMGQGVPPGNFVNQRQIPGRQQLAPQQQQQYLYPHQLHQIAKQKLQQNYGPTSAQPHIQQQHQNMLQGHFQPSQQNQQPMVPQSAQPVIQHHQQSVLRQQRQQQQQQQQQPQSNPMGQQSSYSDMQQQQQQPRLLTQQQNNLSNVQQTHQHSMGQQHNFSAMHLGPQNQLLNSTMLNNQHSTHLMQSKVSISQQNQPMQGQRPQPELQQQVMPPLQTQSGQLQHQLNMKLQPNLSQREMQQRLPTSGAFQQKNVIDQQKHLFQQQRAMPEASSTSSDSTAQTGNPNGGDWQEEVYQKIKAMKDKYMLELNDAYQKIVGKLQQHESVPQQPKNEQVDRLKTLKHAVERFMAFLQVPKTNISPNLKEKLGVYERNIINIINSYIRKPGGLPLQQPLPPPHIQGGTMAAMQQNNMGGLHNNPGSPLSGISNQQLKQLQHCQMQPQLFNKQQLIHQQQQQQFQRQTKQQLQMNQVALNDSKQQQQQQQKSGYQQQLKSGPPFSPQLSQDQLNSLTKSGTPGNSPFTILSPSTPSTCHMPGESEKVNSGVSSLSNAGNVGNQSNVAIAIGTPGMSASPLLADGNHGNNASVVSGKSSSIEQPIEHLLKVVKSISEKSLSASVGEIGSVVSMMDSIAGHGSRGGVGEDLVATTKCRLQMKRLAGGMPFNVVSCGSSVNHSNKRFNQVEASELESTATSTVKRPRIQMRNGLLEEIRGINHGLIDTVVDISEEASEVGKGSVVTCSFSAPKIKSQYASSQMLAIEALRLLVPENYPNCSPILLDNVSKELYGSDLSMKARRRFDGCVRRLSEPMSLEEMARTWDMCARAVISEYAQQTSGGGGGGTFTSKYGAWDDYA